MNTTKNAHYRAYLEGMAQKAGLRAHVTQDGNKAIWAFKNTPIALVSLTPIARNEDDDKMMLENSTALAKAMITFGPEREELFRSLVTRAKPFDMEIELFAGIPEEVKDKILQNIEQAEKNIFSEKEEVRRTKTLVVTRETEVQRPRIPPVIQEFLAA